MNRQKRRLKEVLSTSEVLWFCQVYAAGFSRVNRSFSLVKQRIILSFYFLLFFPAKNATQMITASSTKSRRIAGCITLLHRIEAMLQRSIRIPGVTNPRTVIGSIESKMPQRISSSLTKTTSKLSAERRIPIPKTVCPAQWHVPKLPFSCTQGPKKPTLPIVIIRETARHSIPLKIYRFIIILQNAH